MVDFCLYPEELEPITFNGVSYSPYGTAKDGLIVFIDRDSMVNINCGETWECKLIRNNNASKKNYFAWPINKIENPPEIDEMEEKSTIENETESDLIAITKDSIVSDLFTNERYSVYRSINGRIIEIIPNPNGNVQCISNSINIEGLEDIIPDDTSYCIRCIDNDNGYLVIID